MTKEELQNYGHNKTTTTPETTKQEDFRQPPAHARFTHVHSRTRQFGECHHTHNNSHSTTLLSLTIFLNSKVDQTKTLKEHHFRKRAKTNRYCVLPVCVYDRTALYAGAVFFSRPPEFSCMAALPREARESPKQNEYTHAYCFSTQ